MLKKKREATIVLSLTVMVGVMAFDACSGDGSLEGGTDDPAPITREWLPDGNGFIQYYTNDPENLDHRFLRAHGTVEDSMTSTEGTVKKMSGYNQSGYGIVFCFQDENNYYRVLINVIGRYTIQRIVDGAGSIIKGWGESTNLNLGYGIENTIRIDRRAEGVFDLFFNGVLEHSFTDSSFSGGRPGSCVLVSTEHYEFFPDTPVDVRVRFTLPSVEPAS